MAAALLLLLAATVLLQAVPNQPGPAPEPDGSAARTSSNPPPAAPPVRLVTIRYEITGPGLATMAYTDGASRRVDMGLMDMPWVHEESAEPSFMAAAVSVASADPKVRLACRIYIDGQKVAGMTGLGSVSCVQGD